MAYRSHLLVLKSPKEELIQIDFTKVKSFKIDKANKYKLEHIDAFTSHFKSEADMKIKLFQENIIDRKTFEKSEVRIYPVSREKVKKFIDGKVTNIEEAKYADEPLEYGATYGNSKHFFESDGEIIDYIYNRINDINFITKLVEKYLYRTNYSDGHISTIKSKIQFTEEQLNRYYSAKVENEKKSLYMQLKEAQEMNGLLKSMLFYSKQKSNGEYFDREAEESTYNTIREFVLREKYYVTNTEDGLNDRRMLSFKKNKDGSRSIKYLKYRNLIMFIATYIEEEKIEEERKRIEEIEKQNFGKQMTLFDLPGFKK